MCNRIVEVVGKMKQAGVQKGSRVGMFAEVKHRQQQVLVSRNVHGIRMPYLACLFGIKMKQLFGNVA